MTKQTEMKRSAGYKAADFIEPGMLVGLGTGSTTTFFIEQLGKRCQSGLHIHAVASSTESFQLASQWRIPLIEIDQITSIDITVDGADEIDPQKRMIKGGGGAHVREKIVASMSHELVIIVDETKLVPALGRGKLPVEILPFAKKSTMHHIHKLGYTAKWRKHVDGSLFITDNGNFIADLFFNSSCTDPEKEHMTLINIPGVVDTGFFFNLAGRVIIGFADGQVIVK